MQCRCSDFCQELQRRYHKFSAIGGPTSSELTTRNVSDQIISAVERERDT